MSKSPKRVTAALEAAGLSARPIEMPDETRTAQQAADAVGCRLDQIAKSILFGRGEGCALFLTAGGNQVDPSKAAALAGAPLTRADAATVRRVTGFAIGGVSPIGHLTESPVWIDPRLSEFPEIWAAGGTPRHVFPIAPADLIRIAGAVEADFTMRGA
ncbi:YbaK/EbsC family protein [Jannaschia seohaensis]|uniref:Cys-tRNA(Pro) deacylase, prolyl-tRNA editing enzyme YbaK/EbsC n=1 Tax=Jannaschia seohaensis TaxID=475081 RepID=A0A2Y9ADB4_9RHOB|nr:YbaK/EbsC family protein [Jannaschia seohaensis]PWJ20848.1 prolyl-tRNA editing enzyme YbaK/EbsC (Cys-tRNA(Pro) deacylase) [Jannaschia seohaensis]SSA41258.1 Cys-tRNA(Pro) deacylase, prolyl-tRNA editing enzyme YbaK/EbsC [Jannaschia seohaensis]